MRVIVKFCTIFLLFLHSNYVSGACQYAQQYFNVLSRSDSDLQTIYNDYMNSPSYDNYDTDCHRFVSQPPTIPDAIFEHAFNSSIDQTDRYTLLDIATVGSGAPKQFTDQDRNNFYLESVTKYIQETTCASKRTTTMYFSTLNVDKFNTYMNDDVSTDRCDGGHVQYPLCNGSDKYRSFDGTCNNLEEPLNGRARDCMLRLLPPDYKDGVSEFRTSADGSPLPNARIISVNLLGGDDKRPFSTQYTDFHSFLGEFFISDSGATLNHDTGLRIVLQSCDHQNKQRANHPQCAGIVILSNDTIRNTYPDQTCMPFARTLPCPRCHLGPRMIANAVTAAQDLGSVYGSSTEMSNARRTMVGGLLKSQIIGGEEIYAVERTNATGRFRCFEEDCELSPFDGRNLQLTPAQAFALLFHRNHNWHAKRLAKIHPDWSDEKVFQEARRLNIAEYQHCIYNEYLPTLIGRELARQFEIQPKPPGQFSTYRPDVALKTVIEFQSTAGRAGHAALTEDFHMIDPITGVESKINFRDWDLSEKIFYGGLVDAAFLAQIVKPSFETTPSVPFKTFLLNTPGRTFGLDLAALDIQRQRDHGIPGYIHYIKYCHNVEIRRWNDLYQFIEAKNVAKLRKYYKYVEDVDLYVGGRFEKKIPDGLVGATFGYIMGLQFYKYKFGDRFFFEHGDLNQSFTKEQLNEIKKVTMSSILCRNTKLKEVTLDPLRLKSSTNPSESCPELNLMDYADTPKSTSSVSTFFSNLVSAIKNIF